ncbi:hypothetical protein IHE56_14095 [Streptomyces sp. ID01-12c]|nr:hypothetical protein [Streptomyces caniscabiei]
MNRPGGARDGRRLGKHEDATWGEMLAAKATVMAPSELDMYLQAFACRAELAAYGADAQALVVKAVDALR